MPAIIKPLLGLALLFGRLQAETPYEALCSSPPSQPDELEPGVTATYQCGHAFYTDDWTGKSSFAETPKACALQCARWSSEGRCGWQSDVCYQYNAGKDSAARAGGVAIYIEKTATSVPDCSALDEECKRNIAIQHDTITSQQDIITSMGTNLTSQQEIINRLQDEKRDCDDLLSRKRTNITRLQNENQRLETRLGRLETQLGPGAKLCPDGFPTNLLTAENHQCIFTVQGSIYEYFHRKTNGHGWGLPNINTRSFNQCAIACAQEPTCHRFAIHTNGMCVRHPYGGGIKVPTKPSPYDTVHRIG